MDLQAVIFDLDGVIVSTDEFHYKAWKVIADRENIPFNKEINERLRGVSRMESLEIILENADREYTKEEKEDLAEIKNNFYKDALESLSEADILPGVIEVLEQLKFNKIKIAIGSSSKNTKFILSKIGIVNFFDAVADGNEITNSKPDPEVFLLAVERLGVKAENCLVVEDAEAGVDAAISGGMKVLAVGYASNYNRANLSMNNLEKFDLYKVIS